jgi:hypothetical protein
VAEEQAHPHRLCGTAGLIYCGWCRNVGVWLKNTPIPTDFVALLDEWAARFFEELDYVREGNNATKFAAQMKADLPQVGLVIVDMHVKEGLSAHVTWPPMCRTKSCTYMHGHLFSCAGFVGPRVCLHACMHADVHLSSNAQG